MKSMFPMPINLTGKVMTMELQRQNVISSNIANVNTPNYKPRELDFEKELQSSLNLDMNGRMSRTDEQHIPVTFDPNSFGPEWNKQFKPRQIHGEDRVNMDKEMAKLAKNQLHYSALTQVIARSFEGIKTVIQESKQV